MTTSYRCFAHAPQPIFAFSADTTRAGMHTHSVDGERRRGCGDTLTALTCGAVANSSINATSRAMCEASRAFFHSQCFTEMRRALGQALRQGCQFNASRNWIVRDARAAGECCTSTHSAAVATAGASVTSAGAMLAGSDSARRGARGSMSTQSAVMLGGPRALWQAGDEEVQGHRRGDEQTIFALSSGAGRAGIAVLRVSGPSASTAQVPTRGPRRSRSDRKSVV